MGHRKPTVNSGQAVDDSLGAGAGPLAGVRSSDEVEEPVLDGRQHHLGYLGGSRHVHGEPEVRQHSMKKVG